MVIEQFKKLTNNEIDILLKATAIVSVLAVSDGEDVTKKGKAEAVKLAHIETYSANPVLLPYYEEIKKKFKSHFEEAVNKYDPFDDNKGVALKKEIHILNTIIDKLDREFAEILHKSLSGYAEHVRKADGMFLEDFIFPIPLLELTD